MRIYSVFDKEFKPYGKVLEGYNTEALCKAASLIELPESGVAYEPAIESLENCKEAFKDFEVRAYGGMPIEIGMCWGRNTKLNALEYHRDSELNIGSEDYVLLVARVDEIEDGKIDSSVIKAFRAPKGAVVEVYSTTLHYAPCTAPGNEFFHTVIVLPKGTNYPKPELEEKFYEDKWLAASNKWLIVHPESNEAKNGSYIGITGKNIDIAE